MTPWEIGMGTLVGIRSVVDLDKGNESRKDTRWVKGVQEFLKKILMRELFSERFIEEKS